MTKWFKRRFYLVKVHELHLVVRDLLLVGTLEHEGHGVRLVLGLHGDVVVVCGTPGVKKVERWEFCIFGTSTSESWTCW